MFNVSNNNIITITRGDTAETALYINLGTCAEPILFDANTYPNAKVYFGLMEPNQPFEHAILKKVYYANDINSFVRSDPTDPHRDTLILKFYSSDTENLLPGVYYYSIKLYRPGRDINDIENERIDTIIPKRKFIILD